MGIKAAQTLHNDIIPIVNIVWVDAAIHQAAALAVLTAGRKKLSLVDCASFEVMRLSGATKAFAFDRHFSALPLPLKVHTDNIEEHLRIAA